MGQKTIDLELSDGFTQHRLTKEMSGRIALSRHNVVFVSLCLNKIAKNNTDDEKQSVLRDLSLTLMRAAMPKDINATRHKIILHEVPREVVYGADV